MKKTLCRLLFAMLALAPLSARATPASGYWWNTAQPGRGFVIEIQGNTMFMAGFLYAASGESTWVASSGPMASPAQFTGPLVTYGGGQTLTGSFQPATQNPNALGTIAITFTSDTTGSVTWPGGTVAIQRFDIVPGGSSTLQPATNPEPGWWWNPNEGGRGFAVEVQNGAMYLAGYMYDGAGNPLWYLASGNMSNTTVFNGEWTQFGNGQTLTGSFQPATVVNGSVGTALLQFANGYSATLTLPTGRQIPFTRYAFGVAAPVLSAITPSDGSPETLVTVNGTGFDPAGTVSLQLSDNTGYSVAVPAASVTSGSFKVAVPPYIVAASGAFGSGAVQLQAIQKSSGITLASNVLSGFTIDALPAVSGTPGSSTLSLLRANLSEAQKLQTSIIGTPQNTPAVNAALAQQISNLQTLVFSVQQVVQNGLAFSLGTIGGVSVTVNSSNIVDVDSLILATLNSLANPPSGSALKSDQAAGVACLATEASAYATAMTGGGGSLDQLAQNLVEASGTSPACATVTAFTSAYQIFGGAGNVGLGIANNTGNGVIGNRLAGAALFAATTENATTAVGLNAVISPQLSSQAASVQGAIAKVAALSDPTANLLIAKSTGQLATVLTAVQGITDVVAPPPTTSAAIAGTVAGNGAVANAAVTVLDSSGKSATATAAADGTYTANVTGMTAPIVVFASDPTGLNGPLVSVAATLPSSGTATVNLSLLTTAIAALLTTDGNAFGLNASKVSSLVTPVALANAVSVLNQTLSTILTANGLSAASFNPITTKLVANDTGADAVANAINLLPYGGGLEIVATADATQALALAKTSQAPATPFPAPPVASNYFDFMEAELEKCSAVPLANRVNDATCIGIVDANFLSNGYTSIPAEYTDFLLQTSVGSTVTLPKTLLFYTDTSGNQLAIVRFRYTLTDGSIGRLQLVARKVPAGTTPVTLPDGTVANWNFYGNQVKYDASVASRADRRTFLDPADTSYYDFGLDINFNPSGPNAAPVNSVNVSGPGLPSGGIWLFRSSVCGTATYMAISGTFHTGPPNGGSQSTTTSNTSVFKWSWAGQGTAAFTAPTSNQQWAASPVTATTIPYASLYTFQLYDVNGNPIASFTRRNTAPPLDVSYLSLASWPTLSGAVASSFLSPTGSLAAAQTNVTVNWTNASLGIPGAVVHIGSGASSGSSPPSVDGFGPPAGAVNSAVVTAGVSKNGATTSLCTGAQFSALTGGVFRFIQLQARDPWDVQAFDLTEYLN